MHISEIDKNMNIGGIAGKMNCKSSSHLKYIKSVNRLIVCMLIFSIDFIKKYK